MGYKFNPFTVNLDNSLGLSTLDSRYVNVTGDTMTGDLLINGGHCFASGSFDQASTTVGTYFGVGDGTPRLMFSAGNASTNWQIDNLSGTFRWFLPGSTKFQLESSLTSSFNDLLVKPSSNSTTAIETQQSDGTQVFAVDTTNRKVVVTSGTTGQSTIGAGLVVNNDSGSDAINDFQVNSDTATALFVDASADTLEIGVATEWLNGATSLGKITANGAIEFQGTGAYTAPSGAGTRLVWHPAKGAFRAGTVAGATWDDGSIGTNSFAIGLSNTASGARSFAVGNGTLASGDDSVALGSGCQATETFAIAIGRTGQSTGNSSIAMGNSAVAGGNDTIAIGRNASAGLLNSVAIGYGATTGAYASTALSIGISVNASAYQSIAIGSGITEAAGSRLAIGFTNTALVMTANDINVLLPVTAATSATVPLTVKGAVSQSANLHEWQDSSATVLSYVDSAGAINIKKDTDTASTFGRASVGFGTGLPDFAHFSHVDLAGAAGSYAIIQGGDGSTYINAADGKTLRFRINNVNKLQLSAGTFTVLSGVAFVLDGNLGVNNVIYSNNDLYFDIDNDNDGTNSFYFRNGADTTLLTINEAGNVLINGFTSSTVGLTVKGAASQTANLTEWQDSSGTAMLKVQPDGDLEFVANNIVTDTTTGTKIGTATGQKLAFYGSTPIVQAVLATGAGATVDNVITALQNLGLVKQS